MFVHEHPVGRATKRTSERTNERMRANVYVQSMLLNRLIRIGCIVRHTFAVRVLVHQSIYINLIFVDFIFIVILVFIVVIGVVVIVVINIVDDDIVVIVDGIVIVWPPFSAGADTLSALLNRWVGSWWSVNRMDI